jgi:putative transposase
MGKVFHKLFYHVIWTTQARQPIITNEIENVLYPFLENKAKRFHCHIFGIGGIDDHIHVALHIPPADSVNEIVGKLKGSSSYFLNKELQVTSNFRWQDGFGVLSFAGKDLPSVLRYIARQKEHHRRNTMHDIMECVEDKE